MFRLAPQQPCASAWSSGSREFSGTVRSPGVGMWPAALTGQLDGSTITAAGLKSYRAEDVYFFLDWRRGRAYFWRPAR